MSNYSWFTDFDPSDFKPLNDHIKSYKGADAVECPQCKGHGGCILTRDAYGKGKHFRGHCSNCDGWGYVRAGSPDALCCHDYSSEKNIGRCLHEWTCSKCGHTKVVDSSD